MSGVGCALNKLLVYTKQHHIFYFSFLFIAISSTSIISGKVSNRFNKVPAATLHCLWCVLYLLSSKKVLIWVKSALMICIGSGQVKKVKLKVLLFFIIQGYPTPVLTLSVRIGKKNSVIYATLGFVGIYICLCSHACHTHR